jgi:hypothetical protein
MDDCSVNTGLIHFFQQVIGYKIRNLAVARIRRNVPFPKVNLGVYDQHIPSPGIGFI